MEKDSRHSDSGTTRFKSKNALAVSSMIVWDFDVESNRMDTPNPYRELFGFLEDSPAGQVEDWLIHIHPEDREAHLEKINKAFAEKGSFVSRFRFIRPIDGKVAWFEVRGTTVLGPNGRYILRGLAIDITEIKKAEEEFEATKLALEAANEELKKANTQLARCNSELERFTQMAAHDLKEPVRTIMTSLQLLERVLDGASGPPVKVCVDNCITAGNRMHSLITSLLELSHMETGSIELQEVDCNKMVKEVISNLQGTITETNAVIEFDSLPVIRASETRCIQLFQNLIGNALKYCSTTPIVRIAAEDENGDWLFSIRDNGIGIAPQYHEKIFEVFQRLNDERSYAGSGIGLAICKRIVEKRGGGIWIESEVGKGSTFYFQFSKSLSRVNSKMAS